MKKKMIKIGFRGTYEKLVVDKCPICHKRIIEPFCQCPQEPTKTLTDRWIDKNVCKIK